nr:unnamed protein product [Haemonchus contortus]
MQTPSPAQVAFNQLLESQQPGTGRRLSKSAKGRGSTSSSRKKRGKGLRKKSRPIRIYSDSTSGYLRELPYSVYLMPVRQQSSGSCNWSCLFTLVVVLVIIGGAAYMYYLSTLESQMEKAANETDTGSLLSAMLNDSVTQGEATTTEEITLSNSPELTTTQEDGGATEDDYIYENN